MKAYPTHREAERKEEILVTCEEVVDVGDVVVVAAAPALAVAVAPGSKTALFFRS